MRTVSRIRAVVAGDREISATGMVFITSLIFTLFYNHAFFSNVLSIYPFSSQNLMFLGSLAVSITAAAFFLLTLVSFGRPAKWILMVLLVVSSFAAYFMDHYNVIIDPIMICNIAETDWSETSDLLNVRLLYYFLLLGILPGLVLYRIRIRYSPWNKTVACKIRDLVVSLTVLLVTVLVFSRFYATFFRDHKSLRYYVNPTYYVYALGDFVRRSFTVKETAVTPMGMDAVIGSDDAADEPRKLVILVIGEAARADHFSLNGYERQTNPLLEKEKILYFSNMRSCGTSTAYSVPCMFSAFPRKAFNLKKGRTHENVLDVLKHTGKVDMLWRDNNSDSKGVALRIPFENFRDTGINPVQTDGECRDEGMLAGLEQYIADHREKNILIILHQMGNHGPAYYKRYPKAFEAFTPVCRTNQLENCSREEIVNAYDNALLYTDYFLAQVIGFLKQYDESCRTAMIYLSDHGESLGENGIYLHGLPYMMAPDSQTRIPALIWLGKGFSETIDMHRIRMRLADAYSQDNLFHTLLGIFHVKTDLYCGDMDLLASP